MSLSILNHLDTAGWQSVLSSQALFGDDVHASLNKGYYTLDLASVLANNPATVTQSVAGARFYRLAK